MDTYAGIDVEDLNKGSSIQWIRRPSEQLFHTLEHQLDSLDEAAAYEDNIFVFVSFERSTSTIGAARVELAEQLRKWKIPFAAIASIINGREPQGFYYTTVEETEYFWYTVPTVEIEQDFHHENIHVIGCTDHTQHRERMLVLYPPSMRNAWIDLLERRPLDRQLQSLTMFQFAVYRLAIATWLDAYPTSVHLLALALFALTDNNNNALNTESIKSSTGHLSRLELYLNNLRQIKSVLAKTAVYFEQASATHEYEPQLADSNVNNLSNDVDSLIDTYEFVKTNLLVAREGAIALISTANASFIRSNTIALRRIVE